MPVERDDETGHTPISVSDVAALQEQLRQDLAVCHDQVLRQYPIDRYIRYLDDYPRLARWSYASPEVQQYCSSLRSMIGETGLELYHQALLLALIARSVKLLSTMDLPADIPSLYVQSFRRIARSIQRKTQAAGYYLHPRFCKDLGICTLRIIPAGMQIINLHRLPRSLFMRWPPQEAWRWTCFVARLGAISPFYEMHTHTDDTKAMLDFNPAGYTRFFRRVATLLCRNPHVKGVVGASWFLDPVLEEVSPELAYLRTVVTENGGREFCAGPCRAAGIQDATVFSATRKRLYNEGTYFPKEYVVVWPRKELIAWAEGSSEAESRPLERK